MQLLKITSIPIKIKMQTHMAKLQAQQQKPTLTLETTAGKLSSQSQNTNVKINSYQARKSLGLKTTGDLVKEAAQNGIKGAAAATAEYSELGSRLAQANKGVTIADATYSHLVKEPTTQMVFLPSVGAQLSWEGGKTQTDYQPAKVDIEWDVGGTQFEYVPGDVSIEVEQYPDIKIEYTGKPSYVPPSSDPEYVEE